MLMADNVEASGFRAGSPLTTAAVETAVTSAAINQACQDAIELILGAFRDKFLACGYEAKQSADLALYVTTVVEGGIMMSRTYHRVEPLRLAAKHLQAYLRLQNA